jgi:hypothetical protein
VVSADSACADPLAVVVVVEVVVVVVVVVVAVEAAASPVPVDKVMSTAPSTTSAWLDA